MSRGLLGRVAAGVGAALSAAGALLSPRYLDDWLPLLLPLLAHSEAAQAHALDLLKLALQSARTQVGWLILAAELAAVLVVATLLPLLWRAWRRRRATVFVSFHHSREADAVAAAEALARDGFAVRRLPFDTQADHQTVLLQMQTLQRGADALVCLPGAVPSVVDAEVYAAAVAQQPVVFVVQRRGDTLPNAADKRYPVMHGEVAAGFGWAPLAELLHAVTGDLRSTLGLYGRAFDSPWLALATAPLRALLVGVLLVLVAGGFALHAVGSLGSTGQAAVHQGQALAVTTGLLALAALPVLAAAVALLRVLIEVVVQLIAANRASLRAGEAAFRRADWIGLIPGLEPGQPLYQSLLDEAPLAHHERPGKRAPRRTAKPRA